jgi:hypothetical protein
VAVVEASGEIWIFPPRYLLGRAHGWPEAVCVYVMRKEECACMCAHIKM